MNKLFFCNYLYIKRCLKKVSFIILLLSIPILCLILKYNTGNDDSTIKSGIYIEEYSKYSKEISNNLMNNYDSVDFELCDNLETLKKKVANGTYETGYDFPNGFEEKINNCDTYSMVLVYSSPGTITNALTNEYVFSEIFKIYSIKELINYINDDKAFENENLANLEEKIIPIYEDYLNGDDTFSFEYINPKNSTTDNTKLFNSYVMLSIKGVIALLIMFASFMGTLNLYKDDKIGIFFAFSGIKRILAKMSEIFAVTFLASIAGLITIYICNLSDGLLIEISRLLFYTVICTIYCYIIYIFTRNQYVFISLIPILTLGSIIFCPIFIDFSELIPFVKYMSWMFAPKYYLM